MPAIAGSVLSILILDCSNADRSTFLSAHREDQCSVPPHNGAIRSWDSGCSDRAGNAPPAEW